MTTTPRPVQSVRSYSDVKNLAGTFQPATSRRRHVPAVTRHEQTLARHERSIANLRGALAFERRRRQTLEESLHTLKNISCGSAIASIVLSVGFLIQLAGAR